MANPFDLRGPEFLVFYAILGITVNLLLRFLISRKEKQNYPARWDYTDPYKIAYLRAGTPEALRVVLFSLIDRGLLKAYGDQVKAEAGAKSMVKRPIEQAVVTFFSKPQSAKAVFTNSGADSEVEGYRQSLASEGLLTYRKFNLSRMPLALVALFLIIGVSATKIIIAFSRGHYNILFLVILTLVFTIWASATWNKERTGAGDEVLQQLKYRFHSLKLRAASIRPGGMTNDASYLTAVFGLSELSGAFSPYVKSLFPKATESGSIFTAVCWATIFTTMFWSTSGGSDGGSGGCGGRRWRWRWRRLRRLWRII
jgi:uncharacterized protein (TIGR04222 family)